MRKRKHIILELWILRFYACFRVIPIRSKIIILKQYIELLIFLLKLTVYFTACKTPYKFPFIKCEKEYVSFIYN